MFECVVIILTVVLRVDRLAKVGEFLYNLRVIRINRHRGEIFDHGLDLISKGGNGTVYVPLAADDPLVLGQDGLAGTADDLAPHLRFMTLTRAAQVEGSQRNVTTPFVDQNQTYTSNASHQVFLREYALVDGRPVVLDQRRSCRCLHFTQNVARGNACRRALPIGPPQFSHVP